MIAILLMVAAACGGRNDTGSDGPAPDGGTTAPGDELHQGDDPTQGEDDEGGAKGSQDETLEGLGGGFVYRREGGIAGFCDVVTVLAGTATVGTCRSDPPEILSEVTLSPEQSQKVMTWLEELQTFDRTQRDPATADAMTVSIIFAGEGDDEPTDEIIAEIEALALEVLQGIRAGQ